MTGTRTSSVEFGPDGRRVVTGKVVMESHPGEEMTLEFIRTLTPPLPDGFRRENVSYDISADGLRVVAEWYDVELGFEFEEDDDTDLEPIIVG